MSEPRYDIYFRGEILPEANESEVKAAIAKIFNADDAKLAQLFSGKVNTIKKSVDKATAAKYQQAFKKAGAKAVITVAKATAESAVAKPSIVPAESAVAKPSIVPAEAAKPKVDKPSLVKPKIAEGNWDVLPSGSDLLTTNERRHVPDVDIDTSAIKMVSPFSEPEVEAKIDPPAPDTSHISVAAVGEDMNPSRSAPLPDLELDLSEFSVAEAGAPLVDKKEKPTPPAPDTQHIKLV